MMLTFLPPTRRKGMTQARAARIFLVHNGKCGLCGNRIEGGQKYEIDHRIPLNLGGEDTDANCYPAHIKCHKDKTRADKAAIAKRNRIVTQGWAGKRKRPMAGSKASGWRKRMDGRVERRDKETT